MIPSHAALPLDVVRRLLKADYMLWTWRNSPANREVDFRFAVGDF